MLNSNFRFRMPAVIIFCVTLFSSAFISAGCIGTNINTLKKELTELRRELNNLRNTLDNYAKSDYTILAAGDILLDNEIKKVVRLRGKDYPLEGIRDFLSSYDVVFANLETPITTRGRPVSDKPYVFAVSPAVAGILNSVKLDIVSIANNHLMDYGVEGMEDTIDYLDRWNIRYAGAGNNIAEARKPAVARFSETTLYFLAYCERPPKEFFADTTKPGTSPFILENIVEDIRTYKTESSLVFVSLHWGIEQTSKPQSGQVYYARRIIDAGADAVIGHHPHWPQSIEIYRRKPILYSLGNLINGFYNSIEKDNIVVAFYYHKNRLRKLEIYSIAGKNKNIDFQPYVLTGEKASKNLREIQQLSQPYGTRILIRGNRGLILF